MASSGARAIFVVVLSAAPNVACGGNSADVPPSLLDAIKHPDVPDGGTNAYPPPPYGGRVGDTAPNLCFDGWMNPKAAGFDPGAFTRICLGDFHDSSGSRTKLLLIESCAIWCVACRAEYGGSGNRPSLQDQLAQRESNGFRVLGTIFQDAAAQPAKGTDAASWARTYDLTFPFAEDPLHELGQLSAPTSAAPYNVLIDTRTMKIVLELQGDEPATLFRTVDDFFAQNSSP